MGEWLSGEAKAVEAYRMSLPALEAQTERPALAASQLVLSVIIPTFNEAPNVRELVARLDASLTGIAWEAIFVDDNSPDGTANVAKDLSSSDDHVRCIKRLGRRGLASACIEGIMSSAATYVVVIDADLQHDERVIPRMLALLQNDTADLVIGSRYIPGGSKADYFLPKPEKSVSGARHYSARISGFRPISKVEPISRTSI